MRSAIAWAGLLAVAVGAGCWDWRLGLAIAGLIAFWDASRVGRVDRD